MGVRRAALGCRSIAHLPDALAARVVTLAVGGLMKAEPEARRALER